MVLLAAALTSAGRETIAPDVTAAAMGDSSSPAERLHASVFCGGRKTMASQLDQGTHPGKQVGNSAEPPHAPSAPAVMEKAERPDWLADVSTPPPSPAEPSDHWRSLAYRLRGPTLAETFCQVRSTEDPRMQMDRKHSWSQSSNIRQVMLSVMSPTFLLITSISLD
ncbi:hypothetical protein AMECASPLE_020599 [Ameca splendens]|uniref:Uncharacterized protein n=1 Tax=Ameca splendens TaxID=208324 RepID=A0ABV1A1D7_9TELE